MGPPLKWNRLNPYFIAVIGSAMVEIQCPHCEEDIELEDDVFGLFDCPHCDEDLTWEDDDYDEGVSNFDHNGFINPLMIIVGFCILLVAAIVGFTIDTMIGVFAAVVIFGVGIGVLFTAGIMKFLRE
jgi:endogenous inhibitor of DNA gyrase (YacG/DUF329 family)